MTEWRSVPGYEDSYEVSDEGNVRSLDRRVRGKTRSGDETYRWRKGRTLKPWLLNGGHLCVGLSGGHRRTVHSLVVDAFIGPAPFPGAEILHRDNNPTNNDVRNLRWGSRSENMHDLSRDTLHYLQARTHCPRGHELTDLNNTAAARQRGQRTCLACARARADIQQRQRTGRPVPQMQELSDLKYAALIAAGP
jgi:hypothetical protein